MLHPLYPLHGVRISGTVWSVDAVSADLLPEIVNRIKKLGPDRVVLFGSTAAGATGEDSDIDLLVVLDTEQAPKTYDDRLRLKMGVRRAIQDLGRRVAIDLLVYTKSEYRAFLALRSSFSREIARTGRVLYEKTG